MGQRLHRWKSAAMTRFTIKRYNDGELAAESCLGSQDLNPIRQTERSVWEGCQEIQEFHGSCRIASKGCQSCTVSSSCCNVPMKEQRARVHSVSEKTVPQGICGISNAESKSIIKFGSANKINISSQEQNSDFSNQRQFLSKVFKHNYQPRKDSVMVNQSHLVPLISDPPTASSGIVTPFSYSPVAQRGRTFAARHTKRLVFKDGSCNVTSANVTQKKKKYLVDIFTTCVDMRWRYLLALFAGAFLCSWFFFAIAWFAIATSHGDHLINSSPISVRNAASFLDTSEFLVKESVMNKSFPNNSSDKPSTFLENESERRPCVNNVFDFPTALLFSIETQHTIGYGFRVVEPTCSSGIILLMVQSCIGIFVQSLMTGLIFAKLSQPKKRAHTIMFSKCAVITKRDGVYCLLFRVGDMRRSHFVATSIRALLVKDRVTKERECIPLCQYPLDVKTETSAGDAFVFMVWPVVVVHKIDDSSPLWNLSASQLLQEKFEIIVIMEGIVESTGMTTQVRTSYLPGEILWGHCLAPLLTYQKENGQYKIDYAQFHSIVSMVDMPECSAKEFASKKIETGLDEDETQIDISPYFTIPPKVATTSSRISVMQRVRGSLKLRRSRKDKSSVPSTAPVFPSSITAPNPPANVFFNSVSGTCQKVDFNTSLDVNSPACSQHGSKNSTAMPGEELLRCTESADFKTVPTPTETAVVDWSYETTDHQVSSPQHGSSSSDPTSELGRSSSSLSDVEMNRNEVLMHHPTNRCFNSYDINIPMVNVAFI